MIKFANTNPATGVAYGYIRSDALDPHVVDALLYGNQATDISYDDAEAQAYDEACIAAAESGYEMGTDEYDAYVESWVEDEMSSYINDEPDIEGELDGVHYSTSWLGGALHFWIFYSPHTTDDAGVASPCVPNAGILDNKGGGVRAYDVPADWLNKD